MLEYIKIQGRTLFVSYLKSVGLENLVEGRQIRQPSWRSHAGLDGWTETVKFGLNISEDLARCLLMYSDQDLVWKFRQDFKLIEIAASLNPFGEGSGADFVNVLDWQRNFKFLWFRNYRISLNWRPYFVPANFFQFKKAQLAFNQNQPERMSDFARLEGWKWGDEFITLWRNFGGVVPASLVRMHQKNSALVEWAEELGSWRDLNEEYLPQHISWDNSGDTLGDLVSAGVPIKKVFPGCTKREGHLLLQNNASKTKNMISPQDLYRARYPEMPEAWLQYLGSTLQADWAWNKRGQLAKSRDIHGPDGQTATLHYHQLLGEVTDDMLSRGAKTSWRSVMERLEEVAQRRIEAQFDVNVKLPQLDNSKASSLMPMKMSYDLKREGELMSHCVGGYIDACLSGRSFIFHHGDEAPAGATLEVCLRQGRPHLQQIFGYGDATVSSSTRQTVEKLVSRLKIPRR